MRSRFRVGEVTLNGYLPHIVAFNTWQGEGAPPAPDNSLDMRYFEVVLPDQAELSRVIERRISQWKKARTERA